MYTTEEMKSARALSYVYGDDSKIVPCTNDLLLACENGNSILLPIALFPTVHKSGKQTRLKDIYAD